MTPTPPDSPRRFADTVAREEQRKTRARKRGREGLWFGLGMFGLVGWSVAIPMVLCIAIGAAIDARTDGPYAWTLMFLLLGTIIGCLNAWFWITRERRFIEQERAEEPEPTETNP